MNAVAAVHGGPHAIGPSLLHPAVWGRTFSPGDFFFSPLLPFHEGFLHLTSILEVCNFTSYVNKIPRYDEVFFFLL